MEELLSHAKANNKALHVTRFDLADAFGSINHNLINHELKKTNVQILGKQISSTLRRACSTVIRYLP